MRMLQVLVPLAAVAYTLSRVSLRELLASLAAIPASALAMAVLTWCGASAVATLRWSVLFRACGTAPPAPWLELFRLYWVCVFYNTFVPGNVGGDVVRGLATRNIDGSAPRALGIVLLERMLGFGAMLFLVGTCCLIAPVRGMPGLAWWSALGVCIATASVLALLTASRFAHLLPHKLARVAASLPRIESLALFGVALGLSLVIQFSGVIVGHTFVASLDPHAAFRDSLVLVPLINAMQYFPLTVGGAGVREAGYVVLYRGVGVSEANALAASIAMGMAHYLVSALGGLLQWVKPIGARGAAAD
jgi:glycosyltransferase 2 family protein